MTEPVLISTSAQVVFLNTKTTEVEVGLLRVRVPSIPMHKRPFGELLKVSYRFKGAGHRESAAAFAEAVRGKNADAIEIIKRLAKAQLDFGGDSPNANLFLANDLLSWTQS